MSAERQFPLSAELSAKWNFLLNDSCSNCTVQSKQQEKDKRDIRIFIHKWLTSSAQLIMLKPPTPGLGHDLKSISNIDMIIFLRLNDVNGSNVIIRLLYFSSFQK